MSVSDKIMETAIKVAELETKLERLTAISKQQTEDITDIKKDTEKLIELFRTLTTALQVGIRFTVSLGKVIQWIAGLFLLMAAVYTTLAATFGIKIGFGPRP